MYDHPVWGHFMYDPSFFFLNCVWSYTFLKCMILPYFARHHTIIKDSAYIKSMFVPAIWWCWPYSLKRRTIHYKRRTIHSKRRTIQCKRRTIQCKRRTIQCKRRTMLNKVWHLPCEKMYDHPAFFLLVWACVCGWRGGLRRKGRKGSSPPASRRAAASRSPALAITAHRHRHHGERQQAGAQPWPSQQAHALDAHINLKSVGRCRSIALLYSASTAYCLQGRSDLLI